MKEYSINRISTFAFTMILIVMVGRWVVINLIIHHDYELKIEDIRVNKQNDRNYWTTTITLINNTDDTLKYVSMYCSWQELYLTNSKHISIVPESFCDKNHPVFVTIPPNEKGESKLLKLEFSSQKPPQPVKLKVGLSLIKALANTHAFDYDSLIKRQVSEQIIWSNPIPLKVTDFQVPLNK